jgi:DNA-binding MarR family transcriptional regulator
VADPEDRRGVLVELTPAGRGLVDDLAERHLENERALIGALTPEEQRTLVELLKKLLVPFEHERLEPRPARHKPRHGRGCRYQQE